MRESINAVYNVFTITQRVYYNILTIHLCKIEYIMLDSNWD